MSEEKRKYSRKETGKVDNIKKEFTNAINLLDTFTKMYGKEEGLKMFKPHLTYMTNKINNELE